MIRDRPRFEDTFFRLARVWAERSTCPRLAAGCVAVNERHQVLASGYNGAIRGADHCVDVGCLIVARHCVRAVHAEMNMICQAAYEGISLRNAIVYITARPCQICTKMMIQVGIQAIYFWRDYNTDSVKDQVEQMLDHAGIAIYGPYETR